MEHLFIIQVISDEHFNKSVGLLTFSLCCFCVQECLPLKHILFGVVNFIR